MLKIEKFKRFRNMLLGVRLPIFVFTSRFALDNPHFKDETIDPLIGILFILGFIIFLALSLFSFSIYDNDDLDLYSQAYFIAFALIFSSWIAEICFYDDFAWSSLFFAIFILLDNPKILMTIYLLSVNRNKSKKEDKKEGNTGYILEQLKEYDDDYKWSSYMISKKLKLTQLCKEFPNLELNPEIGQVVYKLFYFYNDFVKTTDIERIRSARMDITVLDKEVYFLEKEYEKKVDEIISRVERQITEECIETHKALLKRLDQ